MSRSMFDKVAADYDLSRNLARGSAAWLRRRLLMWFLFAIPVVCLGVGLALKRNKVFWSHPVSPAHSNFGHTCQSCHQPMKTVGRLANSAHRSVENGKCTACHQDQANEHDHFVLRPGLATVEVKANGQVACAACHREHQGRDKLAEVTDRQCLTCHTDLGRLASGGHLTDSLTAAQVRGFVNEHPDFDWQRGADFEVRLEDRSSLRALDREHWPMAEYSTAAGSERGFLAKQGQDPGQLNFNHEKHLTGPLQRRDSKGPTQEKPQTLTCASCHQPSEDGRYMQPVRYKQHCSGCHPLNHGSLSDKPLPHRELHIVRSVIGSRLQALGSSTEPPAATPRAPNKATLQLRQTWDNVFQTVSKNCQLCHVLKDGKIAPTRMPLRWMTGSVFHHGRHQDQKREELERQLKLAKAESHVGPGEIAQAACLDCHDVKGSSKTSDVLLPAIDKCRECHLEASSVRQPTRTRAHCTLCHQYHRHGKPASRDVK